MKIGAKRADSLSPVLAARSARSLEYALLRLQKSELSPYIKQVYLYGSCVRKEQSYDSDVDLLVEFEENVDLEKFRSRIIELKGMVSPSALDLPEVDMHVVVGEHWKSDKLLYYQNIRKEGVALWDTHQTRI